MATIWARYSCILGRGLLLLFRSHPVRRLPGAGDLPPLGRLPVRRVPAKSPAPGSEQALEQPQPTLDRDALEALAWINAGMPDERVGYGPDAPRLTPGQLAQFESASYVLDAEPALDPVVGALRGRLRCP